MYANVEQRFPNDRETSCLSVEECESTAAQERVRTQVICDIYHFLEGMTRIDKKLNTTLASVVSATP